MGRAIRDRFRYKNCKALDTMDTKLLLVDDEEGIRTVLGIALADLGYLVRTAADGRQGLRIFHELRPPIVITDIKMPVMDGIELLQRIKHESPDTEVIVLTGHGDMDLAIRCLKLEATDFVTKPINDDALEIALKRANDRIRMRSQLRDYTENLEKLVEEKSAQLIAAERRAAVGQTLEGLTSALQNIAGDLDGGIACFNDLPCLVSIHSPDLKIIAANQRFIDKMGPPANRASADLYIGEAACPAEATFSSGQGQRISTTLTYPDGSESPVVVHTAPIRNAAGRVELVVEITADVAEIRRLQDALRAAQQRYQQLFNEAPCYITVQDRDLRIIEANRRFREDFSNTSGAHCYQVYQQRDSACPQCPVAETFADGLPHHCEKEASGPQDAIRRMLVQTAPLQDSSGTITHVIEMSTDVTQIRRLQEQLASLGLMVGSVSHAIKGLLTGLDGGMYLVDRGFAKDDQAQIKEGWDTVRVVMSRIRNMVNDILFYAKEKDLKWQRIDVGTFIRDVADQIRPKIERHGIELIANAVDDLKETEIDPGMLQAILANLLDNAIEACTTDPDGRKRHVITLEAHGDPEHLFFTVGDNGVGMDSDTLDKIFTPYFISRKKEGSGLGLFIASRILEKNKGSISAVSRPGNGALFTIRLPRSISAPPAGVHPINNESSF
jgi:signal transduction histidine kinase/FixJ family two-component response regulator